MGWAIAIIGGIILLILIFGVVSYNRFVSQRQLIKDAWANIDTELRRRYDLIPNLVESVRGYASHERDRVRERHPGSSGRGIGHRLARGPGGRRGPARGRPASAVRRRRELPGAEGEPELPRAAAGARQHGGPPADVAALLQRQRARLQPARASSSPPWSSRRRSTSRKRSSSRSRTRCARPARLRWLRRRGARGYVRRARDPAGRAAARAGRGAVRDAATRRRDPRRVAA